MLSLFMKLTVDNFAFIKHADIAIDGITVITGDNNSGKSTVGKILYSIFFALNGIDKKIEKQRRSAIIEKAQNLIHGLGDILMQYYLNPLTEHFEQLIINEHGKVDIKWDEILKVYAKKVPVLTDRNKQEEIECALYHIQNIPRENLINDHLMSVFGDIFNGQVISLMSDSKNAHVNLEIKQQQIDIDFQSNDSCSCVAPFSLLNKSILYNSPMVVDLLTARGVQDTPMRNLARMLSQYRERRVNEEDLFQKSLLKDKLDYVIVSLNKVVPGTICKEGRNFAIKQERFSSALNLSNLSTGVKAFLVLRMLIDSNQLKERDVIILDEPEIHLHPTWQLVYAELIVLLQKEFDLSVVVTTHSNFFMDAIETYTKKYQTYEKLHLYLSELGSDGVNIIDVTNNSEAIYSKMADALDVLDSERLSQD